ncbi:putative serine protease PepD [Saccharopolyspora antimicrobica]|uniref:Serine protease PepD n=1 Tax=Saccharopolyspora antimicrobica TaxID=455193 RepID=A0A1I5EXH3_9PSEU|nr:trypsin-like peptidase domain-containing protein [Saccharopolyspora antimicrobica]RKT83582.1 putative serine protease PepD [Saccharopolyspora antimicrobica]SFO16089.1 putative serine protease PepD [Saccharopolyspora antimicrobica]
MTDHTPGSGNQPEEPTPQPEGGSAGTPPAGVPPQAPQPDSPYARPQSQSQSPYAPQSEPQQPFAAQQPEGQQAYAAQQAEGQQSYAAQGAQPHMTQEFAHTPWPSAGGHTAVVPQQPHKRRGGLVAGVAALALVCGLVGGGVGGYVGYQVGGARAPGVTSLDESRPARSVSTAPAGSVQQVADKVLPSVVQLQLVTARGGGEGSGIVLSSDGYILTNNHVVAGGGSGGRLTAQFQDGRSARAQVIGTDPKSDLAVVKADITGLTPAELGRSDDLPVGAPVVAIGSPFGLSGTVTSGIISAKDRPVRAGGESGGEDTVLNALQTDAAINPGNSGGPLVDMDGNVVGINSAIYSPGNGQGQAGSVGLGFAIPVDQARRIATELKEKGTATQTTLGVLIGAGDQPGALVRNVVPGGPAEQAGIRSGDLITKVDTRSIQDPDSLVAAVRSHAPGDRVKITIGGNGGERTVDATLAGQG